MKLYSWNVNGIRAVVKKGVFQSFVKAHRPDVLCLQETKAERGQIEIDLPGYHEYWHSAVKKGYSGTAIFSREEPIKVTNGFPSTFAKRFKFADELQRDSSEEGRAHHRGILQALRGNGLYPQRQGRSQPAGAAAQALGSRVSRLRAAAREEKARGLLRRHECRAYRARPRQSQTQPRQEGLHR